MSTIEDFKNAPTGATASHKTMGIRVMKVNDGYHCWITPGGGYLSDEEVALRDFALVPPAPTTVREALDLAWGLGHEVKEGQTIPAGTRFITRDSDGLLTEDETIHDWSGTLRNMSNIRTQDPLPDPEPDWLNAPAVFAHCEDCSHEDCGPQITLHGPIFDGQKWECAECQTTTDLSELSQVTPLYPKGQES